MKPVSIFLLLLTNLLVLACQEQELNAAPRDARGIPQVAPPFKVMQAGDATLSLVSTERQTLSDEEVLLLSAATKRITVVLRSGRCEFNVYNDEYDKEHPMLVLSQIHADAGFIEADEDGDSMVVRTRRTEDAAPTVECVLQNTADGTVRFIWTHLTDDQEAQLSVSCRKSFDYTETSHVSINGDWIPLKSPKEMKAGQAALTWCRNELEHSIGGEIAFYPEGETAEATVTFAPEVSVRTFQTIWNAPLNSTMSLSAAGTSTGNSLELELDIGEIPAVPTSEAVPPMTHAMYWQSDRMRVPVQPTYNLLPNPSFEQGLRYWNWRARGGGPFFEEDPEAPRCYEIVPDALFGQHSLKVNNTFGAVPIETFPVTTVPGQEYTLSFYHKGSSAEVSVTPVFSINNLPGKGWSDFVISERVPASDTWQRSVIHFKAELPAIRILLQANAPGFYLDGLQLEAGETVHDFVSPDVEGRLLSSDFDNSLEYGTDYDLKFELLGEAHTSGEVALTVLDYYGDTVFEQQHAFDLEAADARTVFPLSLEASQIGKGVFVLKADYFLQGELYYSDYYRFSIIDALDNTHPTKDLFGAQYDGAKTTRANELGAYFQKWGIGSIYSLAYVMGPEFHEKYKLGRMTNISSTSRLGRDRYKQSKEPYEWDRMSAEQAQLIEDISYESVVDPVRYGDIWAYTKEAEIKFKTVKKGDYETFAQMMLAARRGVKKANPAASFIPFGGTSGFSRTRGYPQMEGLLQASQKLGVTWEGLAIHPYGLFDKTDEAIQDLIHLDDTYQPGGKTRLLVNETSTSSPIYVPEWEKYDQWYSLSGRPTYDSSWNEFLSAARAARLYLIALKYWPRVENMHIWNTRQFIDYYFSPLMFCGAVNTLGHLFPEPEFVEDFAPTSDIKGMVFKDANGQGTAAIWSPSYKVENGFKHGPSLQLKVKGLDLKVIDLMGNVLDVGEGEMLEIPLSPAPLYLQTEHGAVDALVTLLNDAVVLGSSTLIEVKILPNLAGVGADLVNNTNQAVAGQITRSNQSIDFSLSPYASKSILVDGDLNHATGAMHRWNHSVQIDLSSGYTEEKETNLEYFYIPKVDAPLPLDYRDKQWETIPHIDLDNYFVHAPHLMDDSESLPKAQYQMAWDEDNIYLRVSCHDAEFVVNEAGWLANPARERQLYRNDGALEVYFDTFADAGLPWKSEGYDNNDYRYDFYAADGQALSGTASVYRMQEVFTEFANGTEMPKAEDVRNGGIPSQFYRNGNEFGYVIIFPQTYVLPLSLESGARSGFALFLQDRAEGNQFKGGLSLSIEDNTSCNERPDLWPIMILK
ncbi:hypothetical protein SH580_04310 [Coraliomargarita algicola]|uniref:Carbohydrate-binding domain-containing protein n=1 Tax=Coraliomargarita algicola TaxID=3092156 RepID=A0ABZ0RL35_9BACT|nr:hypothetical protein [Coraliomargarita sp. J2-16]WPJ96929.1 hypothetical protein SH580_04310 [Coraliomargarita sp. J2-16]